MKTDDEIRAKFNELNTLAEEMKKHHAVVDVTTYTCYSHTMAALLWVCTELDELPIERVMQLELNARLDIEKRLSKTKGTQTP